MSVRELKFKTPIFALAPMANITTYPFASQCISYGADLVCTPMVHTDTVINNWPEAEKILNFYEIKNYIVQLVGSDPVHFSQATEIILNNLKPLTIDLNFACPDKNIVKSGCGGALIQDHERMIEIIKAVKAVSSVPVSVKTRSGFSNPAEIYEFAPKLIQAGISLLTIHPRTVVQGFRGVADWQIIKGVSEQLEEQDLRDLIILGSGDVTEWFGALEAMDKFGVDGVMIGRGALGRPWIFDEIKTKKDHQLSPEEVKQLAVDLAEKADKIWGQKGIVESRTHFANYFKGFPGAKEYRTQLMGALTVAEVKKILDS